MSLSTLPGLLVLQGTLPYFLCEPHQQPWITRKGVRHSPSLAVCLAKTWTKRWPLLHEVEMPALPCCTGKGENLSEVWNPEILPEFAASWPALRIFNLPAPHKHVSQLLKISICSPSLSPSKKIHIHTKRNIWIYFYWFCFSQELWLIHLVKGNRWRESVLSVCFPILSSGSFLRERSASFSGLLFIFQFLIQTTVSTPGKTLCDNRQCWLNAHTQGPVTAPLPASLAFLFLSSLWEKDIFVLLSQWQTEASLKTLLTQPGCGFDEKPSNSNERGGFFGQELISQYTPEAKTAGFATFQNCQEVRQSCSAWPISTCRQRGSGAQHWGCADN